MPLMPADASGSKAVRAYEMLSAKSRLIARLSGAAALLNWDQRTMMPEAGHGQRAGLLGGMAEVLHEKATDPEIGELLEVVEEAGMAHIDAVHAANLREWRRRFDRTVKIPKELSVALAAATAKAQTVWEMARGKNDWKAFEPHLAEVVKLKLEQAAAVGYESEPYDALLDDFEPGMTAAELKPLFEGLKGPLADLTRAVGRSSRKPKTDFLTADFDQLKLYAFTVAALEVIGFSFDAGRMDATAHPFSTRIHPGDVRITVRRKPESFTDYFFAAVHEAGHAIYSQNIPAERYGEPAGESASLGIHESQSRLWENFVAKSLGFWAYFLPLAQNSLAPLAGVSIDDFHFAVNQVGPSLIRTEADEVTYNLHIILRFELELALTRGDLAVADLPGAFNEKMRGLLGITPPDFASGVMQDVHWSAGLIGYFPTYTLGNLYAAQLYHAASQELGDPEEDFAQGRFAPFKNWLTTNIHAKGFTLLARDLMEQACKEPPNPRYLIEHLRSRYGGLYEV